MDKTYLIIGGVIFVNFIISLIMTSSIKRSMSLKKANENLLRCRNEVNHGIRQLEASYKNCEEGITMKIEEANGVISKVAETLDIIFVHQKELSQLDDVCKNYKIALEKLKIQTEHAEARIHAVQGEIRKAEAVDAFVQQFQQDSERLSNQMQDLKAEYVRLVASTEQNLKVASQNQLDENNQMLTSFGVTLERFKNQFSDYIANEKTAFADLCREQETVACNNLNVLSEKSLEVHDSIDKAIENLNQFRSELETTTSELESRKDAAIAFLDQSAEKHYADMRSASEACEEELAKKLSLKKEEIGSDISSYTLRMEEEGKRISDAIDSMEAKRDEVIASISDAEKSYAEELRKESAKTEDELNRSLEEKKQNILDSIDSFSAVMTEKEAAVSAAIRSLEDMKEAAVAEFSAKMKAEQEAVESTIRNLDDRKAASIQEYAEKMDAEKASVDSDISDLEIKKNMAVQEFFERMENEKSRISESLLSMEDSRTALIIDFNKAADIKKQELADSIASLDAEKDAYVLKCRSALDENFGEVVAESETEISRLRGIGNEIVKNLSERIFDANQSARVLEDTSKEKIHEARETLKDLENRIIDSKANLDALREEITQKKEKVWVLNSEIQEHTGHLASIQSDVAKAQEDAAQAKADRVREEASVLRLRAQQSNMRGKDKTEEKDSASKSKNARRPEDMIEAFPDDIFIGDEEKINLEDD